MLDLLLISTPSRNPTKEDTLHGAQKGSLLRGVEARDLPVVDTQAHHHAWLAVALLAMSIVVPTIHSLGRISPVAILGKLGLGRKTESPEDQWRR